MTSEEERFPLDDDSRGWGIRRPAVTITGFIILTLVTLVCAGCGGTPIGSSSGTSPTTLKLATTTTASTTTTTTEPPVSNNLDGTTELTDTAGYTFKMSVRITDQMASSSIANAPPGKAFIVLPISGTASVTNTTPGRNTYMTDFRGLAVGGIYAATRSVCALGDAVQIENSSAPGSYCLIDLGVFDDSYITSPLASNATFTIRLTDPSTDETTGNFSQPFQNSVTTAQAAEIVQDFNAGPNYWGLVLEDNEATIGAVFGGHCDVSGQELFYLSNGTAPTCQ